MTLEGLLARMRAGAWVDSSDVVPLLEDLQRKLSVPDPDRATRIVNKATEVARVWRGQGGINSALLDELAAEVLDVR